MTETTEMIQRCFEHQHPEAYGRRPVHAPTYVEGISTRCTGRVQAVTIVTRVQPSDRGRHDVIALPPSEPENNGFWE